jgi:elongation factor Ts
MNRWLINRVREQTGVGVRRASEALCASNWDVTVAVAAIQQDTVARPARHSAVFTYNHNNRIAATVVLGCQTDFLARTPEFRQLGHDLAQQVVGTNPSSIEELLAQEVLRQPGGTVQEALAAFSTRTGEDVAILWFDRVEA